MPKGLQRCFTATSEPLTASSRDGTRGLQACSSTEHPRHHFLDPPWVMKNLPKCTVPLLPGGDFILALTSTCVWLLQGACSPEAGHGSQLLPFCPLLTSSWRCFRQDCHRLVAVSTCEPVFPASLHLHGEPKYCAVSSDGRFRTGLPSLGFLGGSRLSEIKRT